MMQEEKLEIGVRPAILEAQARPRFGLQLTATSKAPSGFEFVISVEKRRSEYKL